MQCFRCGRSQLDRSQGPNGLTEEEAEAIGWRRIQGASEKEWVCPFCRKGVRDHQPLAGEVKPPELWGPECRQALRLRVEREKS